MKNNYNYDINIENSRNSNQENMNINHNPYINQTNPQQGQVNPMNGQNNQQNQQNKFAYNNGDFLKGALIGAAVTFLLTNKGAQGSIMKAASKGTELFQAGMEELKERYEDAQAAMKANQE